MARGRVRAFVEDVAIPFYFGPSRTGPNRREMAGLAAVQLVGSLAATVALEYWWQVASSPRPQELLNAWMVVLAAALVVLPSLRAGARLVRINHRDSRVLRLAVPPLSLLCAGLCFALLFTGAYLIRGGTPDFVWGVGGLMAFFLGIPGVCLLLEWRGERMGKAPAGWDAGIVAFLALAQLALGWVHIGPFD